MQVYDLVVIGAGMSGIFAALGAAKRGMKVAIVEKSSSLGGNATNTAVGSICGLYEIENSTNFKVLNENLIGNYVNEIENLSGSKKFCLHDKVKYLIYREDVLLSYLNKLITYSQITVYQESVIIDCFMGNKQVKGLLIKNQIELKSLHFDYLIDASGYDSLSSLIQVPVIKHDSFQTASLVFKVANTSYSAFHAILKDIIKASKSGKISKECKNLSTIEGKSDDSGIWMKISTAFELSEKSDVVSIEQDLRKRIDEIFLYIYGIDAKAKVEIISTELGVRGNNCYQGKSILEYEYVKNGGKCDSPAINSSWPIEFWESDGKLRFEFIGDNGIYQVPGGCYKSASIENLYFAGKNISADQLAIAAARVIGNCMAGGFFVGNKLI